MSLTNRRFEAPIRTGDARVDHERLVLALSEYFSGLEQPKALNIRDAYGDFNSLGIGGYRIGHRNRIIGGDFSTNPWQRGTSFAAVASGSYTADRWLWTNTSAAVVTIAKTADAPTASEAGYFTQHCLHVDCTTADATVAAGDLAHISQRIEGYNGLSFGFGQSGTRTVTFPFWVKSTKTGTFCVSVGNSAANRSYVAEYTVNTTNTWEIKSVTIPVDTSGTWVYDSGIGLTARWALMAGSTYQGTASTWTASDIYATSNQVNALDNTANDFKIALVQCVPGSVATPFEFRDRETEELLCYRYYFRHFPNSAVKIISPTVFATSATDSSGINPFPVPMRIRPTTLEQTGTAGDYTVQMAAVNRACTAVPVYASPTTDKYALTVFAVAGGQTAGDAGYVYSTGTAAYLGWSAEL